MSTVDTSADTIDETGAADAAPESSNTPTTQAPTEAAAPPPTQPPAGITPVVTPKAKSGWPKWVTVTASVIALLIGLGGGIGTGYALWGTGPSFPGAGQFPGGGFPGDLDGDSDGGFPGGTPPQGGDRQAPGADQGTTGDSSTGGSTTEGSTTDGSTGDSSTEGTSTDSGSTATS